MKMNGSGCVFESYGRVPETLYAPPHDVTSDLVKGVINNQPKQLLAAIQEGARVNASARVGQMSCLEYAAMSGFTEVLRLLITNSQHAPHLKRYFDTEDVVERAYMISNNKSLFFGSEGVLAEANRYEAALFTAVEYNQPECVRLMADVLGPKEPNKHIFKINDSFASLSAHELAQVREHTACVEVLQLKKWSQSNDTARSKTRSQSQTERNE